MPVLNERNFIIGTILSAVTAVCLLLLSGMIGKDAFFLLLNNDLGRAADVFFHYWTYMGDGMIWVPIVLLVFIYRRRYLLLVLASILISTLITQGVKNFVYPGEPRPTYGQIAIEKIHIVPGVELNKVNSFPSGHTGTAFTIFLIGCLLIGNRRFILFGFIAAALVGYSRIYLAQHFPLDVGAGIITGILTVFLSKRIQQSWLKPS